MKAIETRETQKDPGDPCLEPLSDARVESLQRRFRRQVRRPNVAWTLRRGIVHCFSSALLHACWGNTAFGGGS